MEQDYITIGKITNFFGIKGEAKVGYSDKTRLLNTKSVFMLDNIEKVKLKIKSVRFQKNFAIVKFEGINDINEIVKFKGERLFVLKQDAIKTLSKDEFLIEDLIGCSVINELGEKLGTVVNVSTNNAQDILNIKNLIGKIDLVPFVGEFFPKVDIQNKTITIKPIEGLLS